MKRFTFVLCSYNGEKTIHKAIDSILSQRGFNEHVDKLILVNNKSTDSTESIMKSYVKKFDNVIYSFEETKGLTAARRNGIRLVNTEWIIFVDDDNELKENWLIEAINHIKANKQIGAFIGQVVPYFPQPLTDFQRKLLESHYHSLALTSVEYVNEDEVNANGQPFGAGMVILSAPLKEQDKKGWLYIQGRTAGNLSSGEDIEMTMIIKKAGYTIGRCGKMKLNHHIGLARLSKDYIMKLEAGIMAGNYYIKSIKSLYVIRRIRLFIFSLKQRNRIKKVISNEKDEFKRFEYEVDLNKYNVAIEMCLKDKFIKK